MGSDRVEELQLAQVRGDMLAAFLLLKSVLFRGGFLLVQQAAATTSLYASKLLRAVRGRQDDKANYVQSRVRGLATDAPWLEESKRRRLAF